MQFVAVENLVWDPITETWGRMTQPGGAADPLVSYKISDIDDSDDPQYFGYVSTGGAWVIVQMSDAGAVRYAKGDADYVAAWGSKGGQSYGYFDVKF